MAKRNRIIILITYFGLYLGLYQLFLMPLFYRKFSAQAFRFAELLMQLAFVFVYILAGGKWLREQFKKYRRDLSKNTGFVLLTVVLMELYGSVMMSLLTSYFHLSIAENQANNLAYEAVNPAGFIIDAVFIAPFSEELVFRGCIFEPFKRKKHFWKGAFIAGILFGLMHVVSSLIQGNWMNLLYIIIYGGCGILLAFPYEASDSLAGSVFTHMIYNLLSVIAVMAG